jgi:hypothetical protein
LAIFFADFVDFAIVLPILIVPIHFLALTT